MAKNKVMTETNREFIPAPLYERKNETYWEKLTKWFAIVMLAIFPFLMDTKGYFNITKARYVWFCILTIAYLLGVLLIAVGFTLYKKSRLKRKDEGLQRLDISQWLMLAYILWATLSSILSPYRADTWLGQGRYEGLFTIILYSLIFILLSFWGEYTNKYIYALGIMATLMAVIAILQPLGADFLTPEGYTVWQANFYATIGNKDCVSGIAAIVIPALICGFVLMDSKWRYVFLSGFVLFFYLQVFIDVDSGKLGLLVAFLVILPFLLDRWKRAMRTMTAFGALLIAYSLVKLIPITEAGVGFAPGKKAILALVLGVGMVVAGILLEKKDGKFRLNEKQMRRLVLILLVGIVVAGLLVIYFYSGENALLKDVSNVLHGQLTDDAGTRRGIVWKLSARFIGEMPIFGSGPDTFLSRSMPYYQSGELIEIYDFAHNDFLQVGVCLGLGGLAIYLAWIISMAIRLLKNAVINPRLLIFGSAMVGYLGHVFFSFSIALVTPLFWVMAGLGNKCMRQMAGNKEK